MNQNLLVQFGAGRIGRSFIAQLFARSGYREGRDLFRKLGPDDRLVPPIKKGIELDKPVDSFLEALVFGFYFRKTDEYGELFPQDEKFILYFQQVVPSVMEKVCGFDPEQDEEGGLIKQAQDIAKQIDTTTNFSIILQSFQNT